MKYKLKFYILISKNFRNLKRQFDESFSNIPKDQSVVVINTLDKEFETLAATWCSQQKIEYYITESNGTAAKGKNSLLKVFVDSDNDYMVQIDGDDFLTPHGVWMYNQVSKSETPPDVICLKHQLAISLNMGKLHVWQLDPDDYKLIRISFFFEINWEKIRNNPFYEEMIRAGVSEDKAKIFDQYYREFYKLQEKYCEDSESHCRVTWLSKKAANMHKFPEHMKVGEDTIFYLRLKNESVLGNGNLDVRCNDDRPPTYVYDQRMPGVVLDEIKSGIDWSWMEIYNNEIYKLEAEGVLHEKDLPLLKVDYPLDYIPNSLMLFPETVIPVDQVKGVSFPLNASDRSIDGKFSLNDFTSF